MSPSFAAENEFHRALAAALARMRAERHTSQGTLAGELGLDQAAVSRVETGNRRLTAGETLAWMEALGLTSQQSAEVLRELWDQHGGRPPGFWSGA